MFSSRKRLAGALPPKYLLELKDGRTMRPDTPLLTPVTGYFLQSSARSRRPSGNAAGRVGEPARRGHLALGVEIVEARTDIAVKLASLTAGPGRPFLS